MLKKIFLASLVLIATGIVLVKLTHISNSSTNQILTEYPQPPFDPNFNVGLGVFDITRPNFQCSAFLNSMNGVKTLNLSILYNTFGNNFDCLSSVLQDPRLRLIEIHVVNEPCARNNRCGSYEFLAGLPVSQYNNRLIAKDNSLKVRFWQYIAALQNELNGFLQPYTECVINMGLESNVTKQAAKVLVDWSHEAFPMCKVVWNPVKPASHIDRIYTGADYMEVHGDFPTALSPCFVNMDGTDIYGIPGRKDYTSDNTIPFSGLQSYALSYPHCKAVFFWGRENNSWGIGENPLKFKDPRKRTGNVGNFYSFMGQELKKAELNLSLAAYDWTPEENLSLNGCRAFLPTIDGEKRGFTWKQSSAHPGVAAILTSVERNIKKLQLYSKGRVISTFRYSGILHEDNYHNRPLWRTADSARILPINLPFHVVLKGNDGAVCRIIDNPKIRLD